MKMKNKWKTVINEAKKKSLPPIPKGWETRAQVAVKLGCSEDNVNNTLKLAFKDRSVLTNHFEIWDKVNEKAVKAQFYRLNDRSEKKEVDLKKTARFPQGTRVKRRDSGNEGVVIAGGRIKWDSGVVTTPSPRTFEKIVAV